MLTQVNDVNGQNKYQEGSYWEVAEERMANLAAKHTYWWYSKKHAVKHELLEQMELQKSISNILLTFSIDFIQCRLLLIDFFISCHFQIFEGYILS